MRYTVVLQWYYLKRWSSVIVLKCGTVGLLLIFIVSSHVISNSGSLFITILVIISILFPLCILMNESANTCSIFFTSFAFCLRALKPDAIGKGCLLPHIAHSWTIVSVLCAEFQDRINKHLNYSPCHSAVYSANTMKLPVFLLFIQFSLAG